jgi:hypothetical protein
MFFLIPLAVVGAAGAAALSDGTIAAGLGLAGAVIRLVGKELVAQEITKQVAIKGATIAATSLVAGSVAVHHAISKNNTEAKMNIDKNGIQAGVSTHRPNR